MDPKQTAKRELENLYLSQAGNEARGQTRTRQDHGTTGPSQHTERDPRATDSGSWDHQSKPGWGRGTGPDGGQTGPRDHGTTGAHRRVFRATDSGSWDTQPKPGWGRGTGPDGSQTGPRDHGTTRAHRTGPPGNRFWIWGPMIYANHQSKNPISASCLGNLKATETL